MLWRGAGFELDLTNRTLLMGVLNVTPDSFSDGGEYLDQTASLARALQMVEEGADIIDIGGESTRPGAEEVSAEEESRRVIPVITALRQQSSVLISIDTRKPRVAKAAVACGAQIVNDIGAVAAGPQMWEVLKDSGAGYVAMHMLGEPKSMQNNPHYNNVVAEVNDFFEQQLESLRLNGIAPEQIALDPGIGFGKTTEHNLSLLRDLNRFSSLGRPLAIGVSRKSFIGRITGGESGDRLFGSIACACLAISSGARVIRAHDVKESRQAIKMTEAVLGFQK